MKLLWIGELVKFLVESMKKGVLGNALAMLIVASLIALGGSFYVQAKHDAATTRIGENKKAISELAKTQQVTASALLVLQTTLQNIASNIKDLKEDSKTTKDRVWQIRQDQIKGI